MTDPQDRIAKFKRQAKHITSQAHLDRIMLSFPEDAHDVLAKMPLIESVAGKIRPELILRRVDMEIKPANPEAPTITEETAKRLNTQREQVLSLQEQLQAKELENKQLLEQLAEAQKVKP